MEFSVEVSVSDTVTAMIPQYLHHVSSISTNHYIACVSILLAEVKIIEKFLNRVAAAMTRLCTQLLYLEKEKLDPRKVPDSWLMTMTGKTVGPVMKLIK